MHEKPSPFTRQVASAAVGLAPVAPAEEAREFLFTAPDFDRIRALIYERAGIALSPIKRDMVYSRLARRLRVTGIHSFNDYIHLLEQGCPTELEAFTNSLTTNLTAFFREEHHFSLLQAFLRPRMAQGNISIWCSAASTGEEPYSIAMSVAELYGSIPNNVKILASDLDTNVLQKAQQGLYTLDRLNKVPEPLARKYFLQGGSVPEGHAQVRPELQSMLIFRQINLLDVAWPMRGPFDAIFCRNVMIYFDKPTQYKILEKFLPLMSVDGLLFAGHSESFHHATDLVKSRGKTVYELAEAVKSRAFAGVKR